MKTIADLTGGEFLRRCNMIRHEAADLVQKSGVLKFRENMPEFTGKETPEERQEMLQAQSRKNINDMLDMLLDTHADETSQLLQLMCIPENGDGPITGLDMAMAGLDIVTTPKVLDFLSKLARSVPTGTAT